MANLIGTKPNQVPTNGSLGTMAFQDSDSVKVDSFESTGIQDNATSTKVTIDDTGFDVTGTVTADGLTVNSDSAVSIDGYTSQGVSSGASIVNGEIALGNTPAFQGILSYNGIQGDMFLTNTWADNTAETNVVLNGKNVITAKGTGDVSFYEDTGTTAKMVWDASAESLGIGTNNPSQKLEVYNATGGQSTFAQIGSVSYDDIRLGVDATGARVQSLSATKPLYFITNGSERARLDSSGNLLVGRTSVGRGQLSVESSSTSKANTHFYSPTSQPVIGANPQVMEGIVYLDTVSSGSRITLPFTSQGNFNTRYLVELRWVSEEFNQSGAGGAGRVLVSVRSLTTLSTSVLESSGNFSSVTSSGTDLQINVTTPFTGGLSNYEGCQLYYKIIGARLDWAQIQNLALN